MTKISLADEPKQQPPRIQWSEVVRSALRTFPDRTADLTALYDAVKTLAPTITKQREHWQAKVRQCVQRDSAIDHVAKGVWRLRSSGAAATSSTHGRKAA